MVEIIDDIETLSLKTGISTMDFPVFYFNTIHPHKVSFFLIEDTIIPFIFKQNLFLKLCQFVFYPLKKNNRLSIDEEKNALDLCITFLKNKKYADRIISPPNFAIFKSVPTNSTFCDFGTYDIDLTSSLEIIWDNIHSKHKNVIRNAEKNGVVVVYGKNVLNDFYKLYKKTMLRSNMYCEEQSYFADLIDNFENNILCGVAFVNDLPVGGLFIPYTSYGAYYTHGASADKTIINGAINYLHWNSIKILKEKGIKRYDFVGARLSDVSGTKLNGIQQFKARFGANLEKGFLWKTDLQKFKCFTYDTLLLIKTKLKNTNYPFDIIDQERKKYNEK